MNLKFYIYKSILFSSKEISRNEAFKKLSFLFTFTKHTQTHTSTDTQKHRYTDIHHTKKENEISILDQHLDKLKKEFYLSTIKSWIPFILKRGRGLIEEGGKGDRVGVRGVI